MKKSLLTLLFILSINTVFAQYAYQNILNTIEANSTVLAAHHKQMEANKAFNESIEKIRKSANIYTTQEINNQIAEKEAAFHSAAEVTGTEIINALNAFRKEKNYNSVAIDNPAFTGLLQAVQVFGDSIPHKLIDTAVFKLKDEQGTLAAIKVLLKKHNVFYDTVDKLLIENVLIDSAIREANKYGKSFPVEIGKVMQVAEAIEQLENFNLPEYQTNIEKNKIFF